MTHPKRIAFVINDLLYGGAQMAVLAIASRLDSTEFEPVVYVLNDYPTNRPTLLPQYEAAGVRVAFLSPGGRTSVGAAAGKLARAFREMPPALVHAHLNDAVLAALIAGARSGTRPVIHEHNTHRMYSWKVRASLGMLRPLARLTICYSPVVEQELFGSVRLIGSSEAVDRLGNRKSCTIANGVDVERLETVRRTADRASTRAAIGVPADALVVIEVARLVPWKGVRTVLEAFGRIAERVPHAHLVFAGEGELKTPLEARAAELGLTPRVHLLGARSDAEALVAASDIAALPFEYGSADNGEAVGLAGLEAMALGLSVVASDYASAHRFITSGDTGILVPAGNAEALSAAFVDLASDPAKREGIGERANAFVRRNFDWSNLVQIYERLYHLLTAA